MHTYNLLEDNINKAFYEPTFMFFLKTIGAQEPEQIVIPCGEPVTMSKQVPQAQCSLSCVQCSSYDKHTMLKSKLFLQPTFPYETLRNASDHISTFREFEDLSRKRRKTRQQKAQLVKYAFDNILVENQQGPLAEVFDFVTLNKTNEQWFKNVRSEFLSTPRDEVVRFLRRAQIGELTSTSPAVLEAMKKLICELGFSSSIDEDHMVTSNYMEENLDKLQVCISV